MDFFKTIPDAIYSPAFYASAVKKPFSSALKYFLLLILLLSIIQAVGKGKFFFGSLPQTIGNFVQSVQDVYPPDLVIEIKNGQASVNQPEPYFLPIPDSARKIFKQSGVNNIIVIDTVTPFSIAQFEEYKTVIWLMKDKIATIENEGKGEVKLSDLSQVQQDITLNRAMVDNLFSKLSPYIDTIIKIGGPVLFVLFIGVLFIGQAFNLLYLLLFAVVIYIIGKIVKSPLTYGEAYVAGMYAITLALIVGAVFSVLSGFLPMHMPRYLFSALTAIVVVVNLIAVKKAQVQ